MKSYFLILTIILTGCLSLLKAQNVYIPDANFKALLVNDAAININGDAEIQVSEAATYTGMIYVTAFPNLDMTGISAFTGFDSLFCSVNQLTNLDVSGCVALTYLNCNSNQITNLNVSGCTALNYIDCTFNQITNLNVTGCTALNYLDCSYNPINNLNLLNCLAISHLYCSYTQITNLDVSAFTILGNLHCFNTQLINLNIKNGHNNLLYQFYAEDNPNLSCIQIDDSSYANTAPN